MSPDIIRKTYNNVGVELDKGDIVCTVATDDVDAENEVLLPKNIDLTRFRKTHNVYYNHQVGMPIGSCKWIKSQEHSIIAKWKCSQATQEQRTIKELIEEGILHCYSIGFINDKAVTPTADDIVKNPKWKGAKVYKGKPLMVEFSLVNEPANDNCDTIELGKRFGEEVITKLFGNKYQEIAEEIIQESVPENTTKALKDKVEQIVGKLDYDKIWNEVVKNMPRR